MTIDARWSWLAPALALSGLLEWEMAARLGWLSALYFPAPSRIAETGMRLVVNGALVEHLAATLRRVALGFSLGAAPALALGLLAGWSPRARAVIDPFVAAAHPVPKIAFLPLIMLLVGIGEGSRLVVIALGACFPVLINTMAGVRQISPVHFDVAHAYGAGPLTTLRRVVVPGSMPSIVAGIRLGLNRALLLAITVELIGARDGLGAMIWLARETLRTEELYASLFVIAAVGIGLNSSLQRARHRFEPWRVDDAQ